MAKRRFKFICEILEDIQNDETQVKEYLDNTTLRAVFEQTYNKDKKWLLPTGCPPYRPAPEPLGLTPTNFLQQVRIWPNFARADLTAAKREAMFINLLEGVHETESNLLIAIKDGTLAKLYPFATRKFAEDHGFLPKKAKKGKDEISA